MTDDEIKELKKKINKRYPGMSNIALLAKNLIKLKDGDAGQFLDSLSKFTQLTKSAIPLALLWLMKNYGVDVETVLDIMIVEIMQSKEEKLSLHDAHKEIMASIGEEKFFEILGEVKKIRLESKKRLNNKEWKDGCVTILKTITSYKDAETVVDELVTKMQSDTTPEKKKEALCALISLANLSISVCEPHVGIHFSSYVVDKLADIADPEKMVKILNANLN